MGIKFSSPSKWWENRGFKAFGIAFLTACAIFIPFMIFERGYFLFYGDFNVQQVQFYQLVHDAILSGDFGWSWTTDLGANLIASYSFYNITSPFLWLTLPFPSEFVPYLMGPLLILKFSCASWSAYIFIRKYVRNPDTAVLGGLLYAFSGFSVYNVFFNHFHEAIIVFPLLLAAMDEYHATGRKGIFALAVFASCWMNYYFFVGQVTFCVIYWCVRTFTGSYGKFSLRRFAGLAFEAVIGLMLTMVVLLPTILTVIENSRVDNPLLGWNTLVYSRVQRYWHIITCLFFPPDIPARANFTPDSDSNWASLGAWLPMFGTTGVFAWMQCRKKHWSKKMMGILLLMAFIPVLNSSFQMFNWAYYARWYYMLVLIGVLGTLFAIENEDVDWGRAFHWSLGITVGIAVLIGLMPTSLPDEEKGTELHVGLEKWPERFWTYVAIAVVSLLLLYIFIPMIKRNKKRFLHVATCGVVGISIFYSLYFITLGKTQSYDTHNFVIPNCIEGADKVELPEDETGEFIRTDFFQTMDNVGMFWKRPTIQAFQSIVPVSIMEFYESVGVTRNVASRPDTTHYAVRSLLSVKYLFDYAIDGSFFKAEDYTAMPGYTYLSTQNDFMIFENDFYIPMGFTYDSFITEDMYYSLSSNQREVAMLGALVVENDKAEEVSQVLERIENRSEMSLSQGGYFTYCEQRQKETCYSFEYDSYGFTGKIDLENEEYVFFSVPWEAGWSAKVDGEEAEILKVNVGFMAVRVPAGDHTIEFEYETPGLKTGATVSAMTLMIFAAYLIFSKCAESKKKGKTA